MSNKISALIKNLIALLIGIILAVVLLAVADFVVGYKQSVYYFEQVDTIAGHTYASTRYAVNEDSRVPPDFMISYPGIFDVFRAPDVEERNDNELWHKRTTLMGFEHTPNATIRHQLREGPNYIYNVTYHTDNYGRRVNPVPNAVNTKNHFLIFFGCSLTFGSCVTDSETLPVYSELLAPSYRTYNYAKAGSSVNWLLALLENRNLRKEINEKSGIGLYVFIDQHIARATGDVQHSKMLYYTPYYEIEGGHPVRHGSFSTGRPWTTQFYTALANTNLFKKLNFQFPKPGPNEFHFMCSMIKAAQEKFLEQFPESKFYVVFHPIDSALYHEQIAQCLDKENVSYIRFQNFHPPLKGSEMNFKYDGHPTAAANRYLASALVEALQLNLK